MNSRKVRAAAQRAFERLASLNDKEFQLKLEEHADGDIANALIDLHYFEVGELETEAFRSDVEQIPTVAQDWHGVNFDYHVSLISSESIRVQFATEGLNYLAQSAIMTYVPAEITPYFTREIQGESKESDPWRLAA